MNVRLWRQNAQNPRGSWEGPFKLIDIQDEVCSILMPNGPAPFRSTAVHPFVGPLPNHSPASSEDSSQQEQCPSPPPNDPPAAEDYTPVYTDLAFAPPPVRGSAAYLCFSATEPSAQAYLREVITDDPERFREARSMEMHGLLDRGTFQIVPASDAHGQRIYGGRFVDEIKNAGTPHAYESPDLWSRHSMIERMVC